MSCKKFSRNKQEKIDLIYNGFFDLVLKKGYHKTNTNELAKSAQISIGTIYKYFPKGKIDIIRKFFDKSMKNVLNKEELIEINNRNVREFLNHFILDLFRNHKKNKGYNLAFRSAIQSDKALYKAYKENIFVFFKDLAKDLRKTNESFKEIPENKLIEIFLFTYNLINAIVYHHLSVMELFDTDNKFIEYLSNVTAFSLQFLFKNG